MWTSAVRREHEIVQLGKAVIDLPAAEKLTRKVAEVIEKHVRTL